MNWYEHDIPTMERKVANYKRVTITEKDPFLLFKILQLPASNDLSDYVDLEYKQTNKTERKTSSRRQIQPRNSFIQN